MVGMEKEKSGIYLNVELVGSVNGLNVKVDGETTKHDFLLQHLGRWRLERNMLREGLGDR